MKDREIVAAIEAWQGDESQSYWEATELLCEIRDAISARQPATEAEWWLTGKW